MLAIRSKLNIYPRIFHGKSTGNPRRNTEPPSVWRWDYVSSVHNVPPPVTATRSTFLNQFFRKSVTTLIVALLYENVDKMQNRNLFIYRGCSGKKELSVFCHLPLQHWAAKRTLALRWKLLRSLAAIFRRCIGRRALRKNEKHPVCASQKAIKPVY